MANTFLKRYHITIESETEAGNRLLATVQDSHVKGKFKFSSAGTSASADNNSLYLYNVEERINKAVRQTGAKVIVRAGYYEDNGIITANPEEQPIIYKGEVVKAKVVRNNNDRITQITLSSAFTNKRQAVVSQDFPKNTLVKTMLENIAKTLDLEVVISLGEKETLRTTKARSVNGNTVQVLDRECNRLGITWLMQNEKVIITNKSQVNQAVKTASVYRINSGRIKGTVDWTTDKVNSESTEGQLKADFVTFLLPTLQIGDQVEIENEGSFVTLTVEALEHSIDFYGDVWDTKIATKTETLRT